MTPPLFIPFSLLPAALELLHRRSIGTRWVFMKKEDKPRPFWYGIRSLSRKVFGDVVLASTPKHGGPGLFLPRCMVKGFALRRRAGTHHHAYRARRAWASQLHATPSRVHRKSSAPPPSGRTHPGGMAGPRGPTNRAGKRPPPSVPSLLCVCTCPSLSF